jgi:small subunit ribosomal protein S20
MANTKSAIKNARKITRRHARNQRVQTRLKTLAKNVRRVATEGDAAQVKTAAQAYVSALDKAAANGIIHRNSANRHKAGCAKLVSAT